MRQALGLVHLYIGTGKGKTSAAMGLALRALGGGLRVYVAQFLKDGSSGEISALGQFPGATVAALREQLGFTVDMDDAQRTRCRKLHEEMFRAAVAECEAGRVDLVIFDEVVDACNAGLLDLAELVRFVSAKHPHPFEMVMTGRDPAQALVDSADYITFMRKDKHPFDTGIAARRGIEW